MYINLLSYQVIKYIIGIRSLVLKVSPLENTLGQRKFIGRDIHMKKLSIILPIKITFRRTLKRLQQSLGYKRKLKTGFKQCIYLLNIKKTGSKSNKNAKNIMNELCKILATFLSDITSDFGKKEMFRKQKES